MSPPGLTLYLIRHGASTARYQNPPVRQGPLHPLSDPTGVKQSENRGQELGRFHVDAFYTSPLLRAAQTAQIISRYDDVPFPPIEVPEIQELIRPDVIYGVPLDSFANGLYKTALKDSINRSDLNWRIEDQTEVWHLLLSSLRDVGLNHTPRNRSESWADLLHRVIIFKNKLVEESMGKRVAMVTHSNFVAFLLASMLLQKPDPASIFSKSSSLYLKHGGMAIVEYRKGTWNLTRFDHNRRSP